MISSTKIKKYLSSTNKDFKMFKIKLSESEQKTISNLDITSSNTLNYCGNLKLLDFNNFFKTIGKNNFQTCKSVEQIVTKITKKVLAGFACEHFWISIRASKPNNFFDIPRWHYDGAYFSQVNSQAKFAMVLKGPGTLVIKKSSKVEKAYEKIKIQHTKEVNEQFEKQNPKTPNEESQILMKLDNEYRPIYAKAMSKFKIKQLENNKGLVFWGGRDSRFSALHSEPKIDEPRLFISILPSTKENIIEWKNKMGLK